MTWNITSVFSILLKKKVEWEELQTLKSVVEKINNIYTNSWVVKFYGNGYSRHPYWYSHGHLEILAN